MKKTIILFQLFTLFNLTANSQAINTAESVVEFTISNFNKEVAGTFKGMSGDVSFSVENPALINNESMY